MLLILGETFGLQRMFSIPVYVRELGMRITYQFLIMLGYRVPLILRFAMQLVIVVSS